MQRRQYDDTHTSSPRSHLYINLSAKRALSVAGNLCWRQRNFRAVLHGCLDCCINFFHEESGGVRRVAQTRSLATEHLMYGRVFIVEGEFLAYLPITSLKSAQRQSTPHSSSALEPTFDSSIPTAHVVPDELKCRKPPSKRGAVFSDWPCVGSRLRF